LKPPGSRDDQSIVLNPAPPGLLFFLAIAAGAAVGVLYVIACQVRNKTSVHDLKIQVEVMRADYERRKQAMKGEEVIFAEPVEESVSVKNAA